MKRIVFLISYCVLFASIVLGQEMTVKAPSSIACGQRFHVRYEVNDKGRDFQGPSFKGFSVLSGPSISNSSSTSWINGNVTHSVTTGFDYIILADQEGTFTVGAASCVVDGKKVTCPSFTIKVEKGQPNNATNNQSYGNQSRAQSAQQTTELDSKSIFARASVSKSNPYQGEQIIITYKIYTQVPISQFQIDKLPGNKGFWSEDLSEGRQIKQSEETIDGRRYQVAEIRKGAMFGQESGSIKIEPLDLDVLAMVQRQRKRTGSIWDLFDDPFFNPAQAVEKHLRTNAINVNVKALPSAPNGYCGGVGRFEVKNNIDQTEVRANEAISYSITIQGSGNLMLINAPEVEFPQVFEVYDPETNDKITRSDNGISGSRTFKWILIPRSEGEYEIPETNIAFFDPQQGQYVIKNMPAIAIKVNPGDPKSMQTVTSKNDVKILNTDINYIKTKEIKLSKNNNNNVVPIWYYITIIIIALATIVTLIIGRKYQHQQKDVAKNRNKRATKQARRRLKTAEKYLTNSNDNLFYEEIYRAIWGWIADKFNIELSKLSVDTVKECLTESKVQEDSQQRILDTLEHVNFARFAPGDSSTRKQKIYEEALDMIASL